MNPYYSGPPSDHFDGLRFFNPDHAETDRGFRDLLRWKLKERAARWPRSVPMRQALPERRVTGLRATIVGHASVLIQAGGLNVLTDPVWSERASPLPFVGPRRVCAPGIAFEALPPIDAVLLSHNHYDHMDLSTLRRLNTEHRPLMVTSLGNDAILRRAIPGVRVATGEWWDRIDIGQGRGGDDRAGLSLVVAYGARPTHGALVRVHAEYERRLRLFRWRHRLRERAHLPGVRGRIGRPDLALIPIGAYAPRWFMSAQHTDPSEAVQILEDLEAARGLGIHWGVFQLTDERRDEPPELLLEALARRGIAENLFPAGEPGLSY